ncbi:MAG: DUF3237 domain-containing protein [Pararhodobacter sp.]
MDILSSLPAVAPTSHLIWEAVIDIADRQDLGTGPLGNRGIVPILGGSFRGGPGYQAFHGSVLPGGADRQLLRPDGVKELDALYEMRVADGAVLTIRNRVVIDETVAGKRYALSHIAVTAPQGQWEWLNRRVILGTLASAGPERRAVVIRGWLVTEGEGGN